MDKIGCFRPFGPITDPSRPFRPPQKKENSLTCCLVVSLTLLSKQVDDLGELHEV